MAVAIDLSKVVFMLALTGHAWAFDTICPGPDVGFGPVTGQPSGDTYACVSGAGANDTSTNVNGTSFDTTSAWGFDSSSWELLTRRESGAADMDVENVNIGLQVFDSNGDPLKGNADSSGTWKFNSTLWDANPWDIYDNIFIALKDGPLPRPSDPGGPGPQWAGFLVTAGDSMGTWEINTAEISHFTVWAEGDGNGNGDGNGKIPAPGPVPLIAIGALAMAHLRRQNLQG